MYFPVRSISPYQGPDILYMTLFFVFFPCDDRPNFTSTGPLAKKINKEEMKRRGLWDVKEVRTQVHAQRTRTLLISLLTLTEEVWSRGDALTRAREAHLGSNITIPLPLPWPSSVSPNKHLDITLKQAMTAFFRIVSNYYSLSISSETYLTTLSPAPTA
jgi:hypothetical protein